MAKVDWLAASASLRLSDAALVTLSAIGVPSTKSSTQWEARAGAKEMSRTMLINKKQGKMRLWDATNIINLT